MLNQLLDFVDKQKLFHYNQHILLGVSGGIDSIVLMDLFHKAEFNFSVAHSNFQLRGEASDGDEEFVRKLAEKYNVQVFIKSFDTEQYANEKGISIQMAARDLRREWFEELRLKHNFYKIATAHHLNDSLETAIFNLVRGTGVAGLHGILPKKEQYVRPLLFATRDMISQYASNNKLAWREDHTNSSVKYSRNLIRHNVIPELKKINPNLEFTFAQTSDKLRATDDIFKNYISEKKSSLLHEENGMVIIKKSALIENQEPCLMLFELLDEYGFNYAQAKNIIDSLNHQSGSIFYSDKYQLTIDRENLFLEKKSETEKKEWSVNPDDKQKILTSSLLSFEILNKKDTPIIKDNNIAMLDFDKLKFPLKARYWQHGDSFYPLGMKHKKKVSDFMIDEKIPVNLKKQTITIFSGEDLVWVVGHRIDDRYKITEQTKKIFRIYNDIL